MQFDNVRKKMVDVVTQLKTDTLLMDVMYKSSSTLKYVLKHWLSLLSCKNALSFHA